MKPSVWPGTLSHGGGEGELLEGARQVAWLRTPESPRTLATPTSPSSENARWRLHPQTGGTLVQQELAETFCIPDGHDWEGHLGKSGVD